MQSQMIPFIDLKSQYGELKPVIHERIHAVLEHGQYIMGPEVRELEERLQVYTGAKHCITVASGTEALLISLMALEIGSGDEVITSAFTFAATAEVILLVGATPVFVDIEPDTGNIDIDQVEQAITPRTKAIIPVSLYGQPADIDWLNALTARQGKITVIEDAAQSFGATYKGRKSCNLSKIGCTSFFPSKPLGCYGDGGAIFTSDDVIAKVCREIRVHGQERRYVHSRIGVGGRMDTLQCAIVIAKLDCFNCEVEQRLVIGARYNDLLDGLGISRVHQRADRTSVFAQYSILVENRNAVQAALTECGVPTAVHYPIPLNEQPAYKDKSVVGHTPVSQKFAAKVLSLPMSPYLNEATQEMIVNALKESMIKVQC